MDPDNQDTVLTNCADATYTPDRLRIRVMGLGPNNSRKNMEIVVNRYTLEYDVNAVVTLPNGSGNPIAFSLGGSNVTSTSGRIFQVREPPLLHTRSVTATTTPQTTSLTVVRRMAATAAVVDLMCFRRSFGSGHR
jgi:hypothetical protein